MKKIFEAFANLLANSDMVDMTNFFRVVFRMFMATVIVCWGAAFLWEAAFNVAKGEITEVTLLVVGFVIGTVLMLPLGFYFGGQDRSKKNEPEPSVEEVIEK